MKVTPRCDCQGQGGEEDTPQEEIVEQPAATTSAVGEGEGEGGSPAPAGDAHVSPGHEECQKKKENHCKACHSHGGCKKQWGKTAGCRGIQGSKGHMGHGGHHGHHGHGHGHHGHVGHHGHKGHMGHHGHHGHMKCYGHHWHHGHHGAMGRHGCRMQC